VFLGTLDRLKAAPVAEASLQWRVLDVDSGEELVSSNLLVDADSIPAQGFVASARSTGISLLSWVGLTLLFPLFIAGILSNFLDRESNLTNLALLLALTSCNVLLAAGLMNFNISGLLDSALLLASGAMGGAYNYLLL